MEVCRELVGKYLVVKTEKKTESHLIFEVEAYDGKEDRACHASRGKTKRNQAMFGPAGTIYVYLTYGMHWMLNIVTGEEGYPAAVLIRGVGLYDGPGKLTKNLNIDKRFYGKALSQTTGLWIEDRKLILKNEQVETTPRIGIGINYAGDYWASVPYRFLIKKSFLNQMITKKTK